MPTLQSVAQIAGVSRSTASLALNGSHKVSEKTRLKVKQVAKELNYNKHPFVSAQMAAIRAGRVSKFNGNIAYLYATFGKNGRFAEDYPLTHGPARRFNAAKQEANERGFDLTPFDLYQFGDNVHRQQKIIHNQGTQGIIADTPAYALNESRFDYRPFPTVSFRDPYPLKIDSVGNDHYKDIAHAYARLWLLGFRRIGYIFSYEQTMSVNDTRAAGYREAQSFLSPAKEHIPPFPIYVYAAHLQHYIDRGRPMKDKYRTGETEWFKAQNWPKSHGELDKKVSTTEELTEELSITVLDRWIRTWKPDAIIGENVVLLRWLSRLNISVPDDISLVHMDLKEDVPDWAGIRRANAQVGKAAVQLLCDRIALGYRGDQEYPTSQHIRGQWEDGQTIKPPSQRRYPVTEATQLWLQQAMDISL